ncbi:hypothetical protein R3P38DRAFT_3244494 [Favolaschia claudopus]|uniref:Uncharacterized protein n=1 Tax=Favolaschia claudopus TaxID=2862362 RepID=A0AAV9Z1Q3_9AGAR
MPFILWTAQPRLLSKKHSVFKAFSHDFSEANFIRDKSDVAAVRAVLEAHGINWEYAKRAKADAFKPPHPPMHSRADSSPGPTHQTIQRICQYSMLNKGNTGTFFSDDAREMVARLWKLFRMVIFKVHSPHEHHKNIDWENKFTPVVECAG